MSDRLKVLSLGAGVQSTTVLLMSCRGDLSKLDAAVFAVDRAIRHADGMDGEVYLHRDCVPLKDVDLRTDREMGQGVFGFVEECEGMCGV